MTDEKAEDGVNEVKRLAKLGEVQRLSALQQTEPDRVKSLLEKARDSFRDALGQVKGSETEISPKLASWIKAHLGATALALADLAESSDEGVNYLDDAEMHLREALDLERGTDPKQGTVEYAWAYAHLGETLTWQAYQFIRESDRRKQYFNWAINAFDKATSIDKNYVWAIAHRGEAYRLRGTLADNKLDGNLNLDNRKALKDFQTAFKLNPTYYWAAAYLAALYREQGMSKAGKYLKGIGDPRLVTENPDQAAKDLVQAVEDLRYALELLQHVIVNDPFIFVQMHILEKEPPGGGEQLPPPPDDRPAKLHKLYKAAAAEFRQNGPQAARAKINAYYAARNAPK